MEKGYGDQPDIKIFVVCHKPSYVVDNAYLYPIQVGAALVKKHLDMLNDDEGDNISYKNKSYCELTAQYWAWKNANADYYGFFHYRRYFVFDPSMGCSDDGGNVVFDRITPKDIDKIKLKPEIMRKMILEYDVIAAKRRRCPQTDQEGRPLNVYQEYAIVPFRHKRDLDITLEILNKKYPEFHEAAQAYMHSELSYERNMFIMKKKLYFQYCQWLFDILFEAEKQIDTTWYSIKEYRVMEYLAERLCGIYFTYLEKQKDVKILELPKTLFYDTAPKEIMCPVYKNGVPIVLSANERFAPYLDVLLQSIVANASSTRQYDIIVLYNDISEKNRNLILGSVCGKSNISIRFIRVCEYFDTSKLFVDQHLSIETYYRLIIPEIMPDYHKILYLDCDMVAERDVAELYDLDLQGCLIGAAKDIDVAGQVNLKQNNWDCYVVEELALDSPFDYFQAGVLILDLERLRAATSSKQMIQLATARPWRCHDQDVLNIVCRNRVCYIPQQWNTLMDWQEPGRSRMQIMKMAPRGLYEEYIAARKQPYMVHFAGYQKPWDVVDCDFAEYFWNYAQKSAYYPRLLRRIRRCLEDEANTPVLVPAPEPVMEHTEQESLLRRMVNQVLPYGSRRREWVKKFFQSFKT